jgi:hypothetical protein
VPLLLGLSTPLLQPNAAPFRHVCTSVPSTSGIPAGPDLATAVSCYASTTQRRPPMLQAIPYPDAVTAAAAALGANAAEWCLMTAAGAAAAAAALGCHTRTHITHRTLCGPHLPPKVPHRFCSCPCCARQYQHTQSGPCKACTKSSCTWAPGLLLGPCSAQQGTSSLCQLHQHSYPLGTLCRLTLR